MRFHLIALFMLLLAIAANAAMDDAMYLHLECGPGQECIDLASIDNGMQSVQPAPALVLRKTDFKSAGIPLYENGGRPSTWSSIGKRPKNSARSPWKTSGKDSWSSSRTESLPHPSSGTQ
jgi:hypothetical protein